MAGLNPAPGVRRVNVYLTPKVEDTLFFELRDSTLPTHSEPPDFGTPHPDSSNFPDHVFVFITPAGDTEPGFQRWYYCKTRESQDDYNYEIDGDSKLTRTYVILRSDYENGLFPEPAEGTADATFTQFKYSTQNVRRVAQKELDSCFIVVQRYFVDTTVVQAVSKAGSARGETSQETVLGAEATAVALEAGVVLNRTSRLTQEELWSNTEETLRVRNGVNQSATSFEPGYKRVRTGELSEVEPSIEATDLSFSKQLVTTDVNGTDAVWSADRENLTSDPATGSEVVRDLGGGVASVSYNLVDEGTAADSGILILDSVVKPFGNGQALKITKSLPDYPTLDDWEFDETTKTFIRITKDVVAPGTEGSYTAGDITEIRAVDRWRSIRIRSRYASTPVGAANAEYLPFTDSLQMPPVLRSVEMMYVSAYASVSGDQANYDFAEDFTFIYDVREPYAVSVDGRLKRYFSPTPALVTGAVDLYKPQSYTIGIAHAWWVAGGTTARAYANARTWQTPTALCEGINIVIPVYYQNNALTVDRQVTSAIPATETPPTGWTTVDVQTRPIKLGYYEIVERQLNLPDPFA